MALPPPTLPPPILVATPATVEIPVATLAMVATPEVTTVVTLAMVVTPVVTMEATLHTSLNQLSLWSLAQSATLRARAHAQVVMFAAATVKPAAEPAVVKKSERTKSVLTMHTFSVQMGSSVLQEPVPSPSLTVVRNVPLQLDVKLLAPALVDTVLRK